MQAISTADVAETLAAYYRQIAGNYPPALAEALRARADEHEAASNHERSTTDAA